MVDLAKINNFISIKNLNINLQTVNKSLQENIDVRESSESKVQNNLRQANIMNTNNQRYA